MRRVRRRHFSGCLLLRGADHLGAFAVALKVARVAAGTDKEPPVKIKSNRRFPTLFLLALPLLVRALALALWHLDALLLVRAPRRAGGVVHCSGGARVAGEDPR